MINFLYGNPTGAVDYRPIRGSKANGYWSIWREHKYEPYVKRRPLPSDYFAAMIQASPPGHARTNRIQIYLENRSQPVTRAWYAEILQTTRDLEPHNRYVLVSLWADSFGGEQKAGMPAREIIESLEVLQHGADRDLLLAVFAESRARVLRKREPDLNAILNAIDDPREGASAEAGFRHYLPSGN